MVKELLPGAAGANPGTYITFNNAVFFVARNLENGFELWRTDGTEAGTYMVKDIKPGPGGSSISEFRIANGELYFQADDGVNGLELWVTDGTAAGTRMVVNADGANTSSRGQALAGGRRIADVGNSVLFTANNGVNGVELWQADKKGAFQLAEIAPGAGSSSPENFLVTKHLVFFTADDNVNGRELYVLPSNGVNLPPSAAANRAKNAHAQKNFTLGPDGEPQIDDEDENGNPE
jgi:ELWxxDGT repeat protein